MGYPYKYTYKTNKDAIGYEGPMPIEESQDVFRSGIVDSNNAQNLIRSAIQRIIQTSPGERVMQPEFGIRMKALLFEQMDRELLLDIKEVLGSRIEAQEPRIQLLNIDFKPDPDNHTIVVSLNYRYKNNGQLDRLDFLIN